MKKLGSVENGAILLVLKEGEEYEMLAVDKEIKPALSAFLANLSGKYPLSKTGIILKEKRKKKDKTNTITD